jgi:hypothetical protein
MHLKIKIKMKDHKKIFLTLALILSIILSANIVLAQTGCFLYPESPFYCSDLNMEKAEAECLLYDNCDLTNNFYLEESCANKETFSECQVVLCKDTCQNEVLGKCLGGEISISEKDQWCNSGCCYFEYYQDNYCDYKESKGDCEIEARNKDAEEFNFNLNKKEAQCLNFCVQEEYLDPLIGSNLFFEEVSEKLDPIVTFSNINIDTNLAEEKEELFQPELENKKDYLPWVLLIGLFLAAIIFYFYRKPNALKKQLNAIFNFIKKNILSRKRKEKDQSLEKLKNILLPFGSSSKLRKIISKKSKDRKHKIKEFQGQELLNEFGPTKNLTFKEKQAKIKDLKKLVSSYERKIKYHPKEITRQEVSAIQKLEQLTKSKEETVVNIGDLEKNNQLLPKNKDEKTKDIISELKDLADKVNK